VIQFQVEMFSIQALQDQPEMNLYSMYMFDNKLIYGVRIIINIWDIPIQRDHVTVGLRFG
jgi:hypothetical protein